MDRRSAPQTVRRGRALLALLLVAFVAMAASRMLAGDWSSLRALGVPTMDEPWLDARTVSGASVALERGLDPLVENPGDPQARPMNYPRVWLAFAWLGGGPEQTWVLAWLFFAALLLALPTLLPLARSPHAALVLGLGLFAPTTWLALERANSDLLVFALCAGAAWLAATRPIATTALVATAALLKLFPIAAITALFGGERRPNRALVLGTTAAFAVYCLATFTDIAHMHDGAARAEWLAYGIATLPDLLQKNSPLPASATFALAAALLLTVAALALHQRTRTQLGAAGTPHTLAAFRIGSAVYLGTFLIGNSFDYRLLFLLLTLPQLSIWATSAAPGARRIARIQLLCVLLLQWSLTWRNALGGPTASAAVLLDEALSWLTWSVLAWSFAQTLPDWLLPAKFHARPLLDEMRPLEAVPTPHTKPSKPDRARIPSA